MLLGPRSLFRRWRRASPPWRWGLLSLAVVVVGGGAYGTTRAVSSVEANPSFCRSCHTMEEAWERWQTSEHREIACLECHEQSVLASTELVIKFVMNRPEDVSTHAGISDKACLKCHGSGSPTWPQVAQTAGHQVHFAEQRIPCTKCHSISLHRFEPPAKICLVCHPEQEVKMTKMAQRYCLDCHQFLRPNSPLQPDRQSCLDCHLKGAGSAAGHWPEAVPMRFVCSQCHHPHEETAPAVKCQTCHTDINDLGKHTVATHQAAGCTTCHQPHEWVVDRRDTCLTCHQDRVTHNAGAFCADCHDFRQVVPYPRRTPTPSPMPTPSPTATSTPAVPTATPAPGETPRPTATATATPAATATPTATATPRPAAGPPPVPHALEGRSNCLACHGTGIAGATKVPANHVGRTETTCLACHNRGNQ